MTKLMLISSLILGIFIAIIPHICWIFTWAISKCFHGSISYAPFGWTALALVILLWTTLAYGFFIGRFKLDVKEIEYVNNEIPDEFNGYKIVQISDLHLSTFDDRHSALERFVDSINAKILTSSASLEI